MGSPLKVGLFEKELFNGRFFLVSWGEFIKGQAPMNMDGMNNL